MKVPLEVTYNGVEKNEYIDELIRTKAAKLEKVHKQITSCRIAVESPHRHQSSGQPFRVRIELRVPPGHDLVVRRESTEGSIHNELPAIIRNAFDAAARRLKRLVEQQRGEVKKHPEQESTALVTKIIKDKGYGFIRTVEGREIYFHRNSVLNDGFDRMEIGTGVRFVEKAGEEGPQASTVQIIDKPASL